MDENNQILLYDSTAYSLSEIELINLIKICLIEERSKSIGRKLLDAYKDSTTHRKEITTKRLSQIGLNEVDKKPTIFKNGKHK